MAEWLQGPVLAALLELLAAQDDPGDKLAVVKSVGGGEISRVVHLRSRRGDYLLKYHPAAPPGFFAAEARGLELLAGAGAVRVPRVFGYREQPALILMEWLPAPAGAGERRRAAAALGEGLARQHRVLGPAYGLDHDHYIGRLPQPGGWFPDWTSLWRHRLATQGELARQQGRLAGERARRLEWLMVRLDRWTSESAGGPALLHGDLWAGNWLAGPGGEPVLIDPAVFYGSREVDLAMSELFGGFPPEFYQTYRAAYPLPPGYEERRPLYQLYYLLVHLNLFGEGYGPPVDRILRRYAGA